MLKRLLLGGDGGATAVSDLGLLALRLMTGLGLALAHGINKLPPSERFVSTVTEMGLPAPLLFAWAAGLAEFAGGLLVALGLATRPAAAFALVTMAVVFFGRHGGDPFSEAEKAFVYGAAMLALMLTGAGRFSVDARLARPRGAYVERFRRR